MCGRDRSPPRPDESGLPDPVLLDLVAEGPRGQLEQIRGLGSMIGIEINGEGETPAAALGSLVQEERMLVTVCRGQTVRWLLPYRAGKAVLEDAWGRLRRALDRLE